MGMPQSSLTLLRRYATGLHRNVEGWITEGALGMTMLISQRQMALGAFGGIGEIGVHHGRYMIALLLLRASGEAGVALDLFEDRQELNLDGSGRGDKRAFLANLRALGVPSEGLTVHAQDSLTLTRPELLALGGGVPYRLFSVDGGHRVVNVVNDLGLVAGVLGKGGVAVLDDFYNPLWPGVDEGLFRYLSQGRELLPFCYGDNKLYLCRAEDHGGWLRWLEDVDFAFGVARKRVELGGHEAVCIKSPRPEEAWECLRHGVLHSFREGWHPRSDGRIWSDGRGVVHVAGEMGSGCREVRLTVCAGDRHNVLRIMADGECADPIPLSPHKPVRLGVPLDARRACTRIELLSAAGVPDEGETAGRGVEILLGDLSFA